MTFFKVIAIILEDANHVALSSEARQVFSRG